MRRPLQRLYVVAALSLLLVGCGQKGPLYLPDHKKAPVEKVPVPVPVPAAAAEPRSNPLL